MRKKKLSAKRGRPKLANKKTYKSVSVPLDLWNELERQALSHGTFVGRVAWNRIRNGHYDPEQDEAERLADKHQGVDTSDPDGNDEDGYEL